MRFIKKKAEFIGYVIYDEEKFNEWRCPNKKCGMSVAEEYKCCPYCGQRIKFSISEETQNYIKIKRNVNLKELYTEEFLKSFRER